VSSGRPFSGAACCSAELHLTTETVRNHVRNLLKGLGVHSRLEAVVVARRLGLISDT
jgi:DNA-binding NarL/FixJ family response regulator